MKIKGIGTIKKDDAMSILTREGKESVKSGDITLEELGEMYKLEMVRDHPRSAETTTRSGSLTSGFRTI